MDLSVLVLFMNEVSTACHSGVVSLLEVKPLNFLVLETGSLCHPCCLVFAVQIRQCCSFSSQLPLAVDNA